LGDNAVHEALKNRLHLRCEPASPRRATREERNFEIGREPHDLAAVEIKRPLGRRARTGNLCANIVPQGDASAGAAQPIDLGLQLAVLGKQDGGRLGRDLFAAMAI
jgi:hypothetical protein